MDDLEDAIEWPLTMNTLIKTFSRLESTYEEFEGLNKERIKESIAQFKAQIQQVIKDKNIKVAVELDELMITLISSIGNHNIAKSIDALKTLLVERLQDELISIAEFNSHFDFLFELGNRLSGTSLTNEEMKKIEDIKTVLNYE